jgi:ABC-type transport system substrate-binding protein
MSATVDEVELRALIREAEAILADQVVIIPLFSRLMSAAVWADEIGGYAFNPTQAGHTWNIEEWFRVDQ